MLIRKCIASLPGLFQNRSFEFADGLNIIVGKNASGKSILSRIVSDMAWFNFTSRPLVGPEAWENSYFELEIDNNSRRYQLIRNGMKLISVRHFNGDRVNLLFEGAPASGDDPEYRSVILKNMESLTGDIPSSELYARIDAGTFGAVSFVAAPVDISQNGFPDYDTLRRLFLDDSSRFYPLYRSLKNHYNHDTINGRVSSAVQLSLLSLEGQLRDVEKRIQILDIQKSKKQKLARELEHVEEEIRNLTHEAEETGREKSEILAALKKIEAAAAAGGKITEIDAELQRHDELSRTVDGKEMEIAEKFSQFRDFNDHKKANLRRLQEIYRKIRDIHASLDDISFSKDQRKKRAHYVSFFVFIIFLGVMYLVNISRVPGLSARTQVIVNSILMGSAALSVALCYLSLLFPRMKKEKERLFDARNEVHGELHTILRENGISLEDTRIESVYEFLLQYFEEYGEYTEKQLELFVQRETLKSAEQLKTLQDERKSCSLDLRKLNIEIQNSLKSLKHLRVQSADGEEIQNQLAHADYLLMSCREKVEDRNRIRRQLAEEMKNTGDYLQEYEDLENLKKQLDEKMKAMTTHKDSMLYILDTAEGVIQRRESQQFERLFSSSRKIFNRITHNQHITTVDEAAIRQIITDGSPTAGINSALMHAVLMSVKIAFTDFLNEQGLSVPMILDDPFLLLDEIRGKTLLDTLKETGQKRQVLVFTRYNAYLESERCIEL